MYMAVYQKRERHTVMYEKFEKLRYQMRVHNFFGQISLLF